LAFGTLWRETSTSHIRRHGIYLSLQAAFLTAAVLLVGVSPIGPDGAFLGVDFHFEALQFFVGR